MIMVVIVMPDTLVRTVRLTLMSVTLHHVTMEQLVRYYIIATDTLYIDMYIQSQHLNIS